MHYEWLSADTITQRTPESDNSGMNICDLRQFMAILVKQIVAVLLVQKAVDSKQALN